MKSFYWFIASGNHWLELACVLRDKSKTPASDRLWNAKRGRMEREELLCSRSLRNLSQHSTVVTEHRHGRHVAEHVNYKAAVEAVRWARQDSNLGPRDYESPALTAELQARSARFERGDILLSYFHGSILRSNS